MRKKMQCRRSFAGKQEPILHTTESYNASVVSYRAASSLVRFKNKKKFRLL
jgi:hypothetical protein